MLSHQSSVAHSGYVSIIQYGMSLNIGGAYLHDSGTLSALMTLTDLTTIEHLERCLEGSETCTCDLPGTTDERYSWIQTTLVQFRYTSLGTRDRGVVIRSLLEVSDSSRHQLTRLIRQSVTPGRCTRRQRTTRGFSRRSTQADILLLAELNVSIN